MLLRLGVRHWASFDREVVAGAHEAHLQLQLTDATYSVDGVEAHCPPGVYHATSASSSTFLLRHLNGVNFGDHPSILEVGVGSGAVLLSLAKRLGDGVFVGVDISDLAVKTARSNAVRNGLNVDIRKSDLFDAVAGERFDPIFFNAPLYDREPRSAVEEHMLCDPGGRILERFVREAPRHLKPGGAAFVTASNIGLVAPLDDPTVSIALKGAELFDTGVIRALVRITPARTRKDTPP